LFISIWHKLNAGLNCLWALTLLFIALSNLVVGRPQQWVGGPGGYVVRADKESWKTSHSMIYPSILYFESSRLNHLMLLVSPTSVCMDRGVLLTTHTIKLQWM